MLKEMICFPFVLFFISVPLKSSDGVKVNMQGSVSIGKEVVETLSHHVNNNKLIRRRSFDNVKAKLDNEHSDTDTIALIVNSAFLCRDLNFCKGDLGKLVNKYLIMLTKGVESVFDGLINDIEKPQNKNAQKVVVFEEELRRLLFAINKLLIKSDEKVTDENEAYMWIDVLKKINSKFQDAAIAFASERLEGNVKEITEVKNKLTQKITIATTLVELKFEDKLCTEYNICSESHECTKALNTLLEEINTVSDDKAKEFIRYFYETLPDTNFYYRINEITAHEFQTILHDMAYGDNIPAKNILSLIQKIVGERLNAVISMSKANKPSGVDGELIHIILSDMDHFYSKSKEPFLDFLSDFFDWSKKGGKFSSQLRRLMKDLQNMLAFESDELVLKLINEMKVFMEITVDPEP